MDAREAEERRRVEAIALSWLSTPYHVHAAVKGRDGGVDCGRFLACVFEEAGFGHVPIRYVSTQFFMHSAEEVFLEDVLKYVTEIPVERVAPGDVVLYKMGLCYAHGAIVVSPGWPTAIVHANPIAKRVTLSGGLDGVLRRSIREPRFFTKWAH